MITLEEAKEYCRVTFEDDDASITLMIEAAQNHLESIGVDFTVEPLPAAIKQALLILVCHFYDNRDMEARGTSIVGCLIAPYTEKSL